MSLIKRNETLPRHIRTIILEQELSTHQLRCEFTRQQSEGKGVSSGGRPYTISYDLMMCKWCGNLSGVLTTWYCPKKIEMLEQGKLLAGNE